MEATRRCSQAGRRGGSGPHAQVGLSARTYPPLAPHRPAIPLPTLPHSSPFLWQTAEEAASCTSKTRQRRGSGEAAAARTRHPGGDSPLLWCFNPGRKGHLIKAHTDPHIFYSLTTRICRKRLTRPFARKPPSEAAALVSNVDAFRVDTTCFLRLVPPLTFTCSTAEFGVPV